MALNDLPCKDCRNFSAIRHGSNGVARRGWCTVRSVYPTNEGPGQEFPEGVKRAAPGELAKPFIVIGSEVQSGCPYFAKQ